MVKSYVCKEEEHQLPEEGTLSIKIPHILKTVEQYLVASFSPYKYKPLQNKAGALS